MTKKFIGGEIMDFINQSGVFEKVNDILNLINIEDDKMVDTEDIRKAVQKLSNCKINISSLPFNKALGNDFSNFGAITSLHNVKDNTYRIIINSEKDMIYQRFSLIHEFGHIVLNAHNFKEGKFVLSTHIDYDLNHIDDIMEYKDTAIKNEELANIFALCVLLPEKNVKESILKRGVEETALIYGVSQNAVFSRLMLLNN